jgi:2-polyprenyl-3-methyl-5-hydroxy-6-metoxy-1,4-benzoquinol methylase
VRWPIERRRLVLEARVDETASHWDAVWQSRPRHELGWYQTPPTRSFKLIERIAPPPASVVDIGGGASPLVAELLDRGYDDVTVVDISGTALRTAREQLGARAEQVTWAHADVLTHRFDRRFDVWHDRAVFHFLTDPTQRRHYIEALDHQLAAGGRIVVATFGPDGPTSCSGLPVERYGGERLAEMLGANYVADVVETEQHRTPGGVDQQFVYAVFRRVT